jgi:dTDP-4-dehydrorhamnose 3,5-epimerase
VIFAPTTLPGVWLIDIEPHADERGLFARTVCAEQFAARGLNAQFVQQSVSSNPQAGTLRGLHIQLTPHGEDKLIRVTRGRLYDVAVDLRRDSPAFGQWTSVELSAENHRQIYIPKGCAHGFLTLENDTEILYQMTTPYVPAAAGGLRWDDPQLAIAWPFDPPPLIGERDRQLPGLDAFATTS